MMKKIILWNYRRGTWQYDVFCLLIVAFIFLTPKSWFEKGESSATRTAISAVKALDFSPALPAASKIEERAPKKYENNNR